MKHSSTLSGVVDECGSRIYRCIFCCLLLLLTVSFTAVMSADKVYATDGPQGSLSAVSPTGQQMLLSQQSASLMGGRGFMYPYTVIAKDSSGKPLAGISVTFDIPKNDMVTAVMRGSNSRTITVTTDANGFASAANTYSSYVGEGYQVFSKYSGISQILQLTASVPGWNTVTFSVEVGTVGSNIVDTTSPNIKISAKDDTGAEYIAGTYTSRPITVHFVANDTLSALKPYTQDIVLNNEGLNQSASTTAADILNNVHTVTFGPINIDKNPPNSSAVKTEPVYEGWNTGAVSININSIDIVSGVDYVYYKLGDNAQVKTAGSSVTAVVEDEGITDVSYWAEDKAGNKETVKTITVKIDKSGPAVTAQLSPQENANGWNSSDVTASISAVDTNSGVKEVHYKIGALGTEQIVSGANASFPVSSEGITQISFWAVDNMGCPGAVQTKEVGIDKTKPGIVPPEDIIVQATAVRTPVQIGTATVNDVIDITPTNDAPTDLCFGIGTTTITWKAEDMVGNICYVTQKITVKDTTNPVLTIPPDKVVEATGTGTPVDLGEGNATDIFPVTLKNNAPEYFPLNDTTNKYTIVVWTATDANGNKVTASQKITVLDRTAPVLVIPTDITKEATARYTPVDIGMATATDFFDYVITKNAPEKYPLGETVVAWTAKDVNGNESIKVQKITITDTTAPVLTIPGDITKEATGVLTPVVLGVATATDIFDYEITNDAPEIFPVGVTPVTWKVRDVNGNESIKVQKVTITDTTFPVLAIPGDITKEATDILTAVDLGQATATDIFKCEITKNAPEKYSLGLTLVTWKATDANGNETTGIQKVTIIDTTAPVLTVPEDMEKEAEGVRTPVDIGAATATDIFPYTITKDVQDDYPLGETLITWKATDVNGNESTKVQKVTVKDTTAPVLTIPEDINKEATDVMTPVGIGEAAATDIFPYTISKDAKAGYSPGVTFVTWKATDVNGNESTKVQKVTITDTTAPVLTIPGDITREATALRTPVDIGEATAIDIFPCTISSDAPADYPLGVTPVTWKAKDANGVETTKVQKITIIDTTAPVLTIPADITKEATALRTPVDIGAATATDIFPCTISNDAQSDYPLGVTLITWKVRDISGNETTKIQKVTIKDTTAPVLTVPEDIIKEATALRTQVDIGTATATDIFPYTISNDVLVDYPLGVTLVTWKAKDANGNESIKVQKITIKDTTAPVLTIPEDKTKEATALRTPVDVGTATAYDIFPYTITNDVQENYPFGVNLVTWKARDVNGNESTMVQKITITDKTAPELVIPMDITKEATAIRTPVDIGVATATDIFLPCTVTNDAPADYPLGETIVTWTATDANGNKTEKVQKITIVDTTAPELTIPGNITKEATAIRTLVDIGVATATDIFLPCTVTNDAPADYPLGETIVTWTAIDANGNKTEKVQKITIVDTTAPELAMPGDITKEATAIRTPVDIGVATATDIFLPCTVTNDALADYPVGVTFVTWTATDANGNKTTKVQKITIVDTTPPELTIPGDITKEATAIRTPVDIGTATATDIFPCTVTNDAPENYPLGETEVTWTATDANGNKTTKVQKITIVDTTPPELDIPGDIIKEATAIRTPVDIGKATATDIFLPCTITNDSLIDYTLGVSLVTWIAEDANGNKTTKVQKITIVDTTAPVLTMPLDITKEATALRTPVDIGEATATDIFPYTISKNAPQDYPLGVTLVTWKARDVNGNETTGVQKITIKDTTPPELTIPVDITKEATAVSTPVDIGTATATDIFPCTITNDVPVDYPLGVTSVTWTATDANGNKTTKVQKITIVDTTPPELTIPADITKEATAISTPVDIGTATATDIFPYTITNDAPVDYPLGVTSVTWAATDANGNKTTKVQKITIVDTTPPELTIPADITKEATAIRTPVDIGTATATDIFPYTITNDAPVDYPLGVTSVTWTATDANGNKTTKVQKITIVDTTPPELTIPADITKEATAIRTPVDVGEATATDIFPCTITNDAPVDYPLGVTSVTWTATDANGNKTTKVQKITIVDTTPPELTIPADITKEATAIRTPVDVGEATATDIFPCTITNDAPVDYPLGVTSVTWTATDANGNKTTKVQKIAIVDTTPPELTIPADIAKEATAIRTPVDIGTATATDIFPYTITDDAPVDYPLGVTSVTWTATDVNGNKTTKVQKITIVDTTAPELTIPADITKEATAIRTPVDVGEATATDIFPCTITNDAPVDYPLGVTSVTWTATDVNGNETTKVQKIAIVDTTPPELTIPADIAKEATAIRTPVGTGTATATATDIFPCIITNDAPADYPLGVTLITWKARDVNGNETTKVQKITIVDTTAPELIIPADITKDATAIRTLVDIGTATATDIFPYTITNDVRAYYRLGVTSVTWTATDANGNKTTKVQKITIVDTTAPELTIPADITREATALRTPVLIGTATATDIFPCTITNDAPADYPLGETLITWKARDVNRNITTKVQKITIVDTTAPVLAIPADITVAATGAITQVSIGTATATDIFSVNITNDAPAAGFPIGRTAVTWKAVDENGNMTTAIQYITVLQSIKLKAYNNTRNSTTNTIDPYIMIENTGSGTIDLSSLKIRYYYTIDGDVSQNYWCDHASLRNPGQYNSISSCIQGRFEKTDAGTGSYYLEISFSSNAGSLMPGGKVYIQSRSTKTNWGSYNQSNDYSFNSMANYYTDTNKITVYYTGVLISGMEP